MAADDGLRRGAAATHVYIVLAALGISSVTAGMQTPALSEVDRGAPCATLVTADELQALGRADVLVQVSREPGSSVCGWEDASRPGASFAVTLNTAESFADGAGDARGFYQERRELYDAVVGTDPVPDLGREACITRHETMPTVIVLREADVVTLLCSDCTREQTLALARLAAAP